MDEILLEFGGIIYYIDFDGLSNLVKYEDSNNSEESIEKETKTTNINGGTEKVEATVRQFPKGKEIDISRYETYRAMLEILLTNVDESDDSLGPERGLKTTSLAFKIAFNTLVQYGVLKQL
jgi:hypothetical protein